VPIGGTVNAGRGTVVPSGPLTVSVDGKPMSPGTINEWGRMLRTIPATAAAAAPPTAEGTSNA